MSSLSASASDRPVVLVMRLSALGDVAMASAVVAAAAARHRGVRFVVVTRQAFAPFFPEGIDVEPVDLKGRHRGLRGLARLASELYEKYRPAAVADIHDVLRTKVVRALLRLRGVAVEVIDKGRREKRRLVKGIDRRPLASTPSRYADVLARLGYEPGQPVAAPLGQFVPDEVGAVGIAPFAAHPGKAYPLKRMAEAADMIRSARPGIRIVWFSAPGAEADRIAAVAARGDTIVARLGLTGGLADELDIMASLSVMIAMDSGNMHMAALHGIPVVSVWGATHPAAGFAGATADARLMVQADMPCRPCSVYGNRPCRLSSSSFPCFDAIAPAMIAEKTLSLLPQS